jgi:RNA polymerase sigma factor (sigma-70 family)
MRNKLTISFNEMFTTYTKRLYHIAFCITRDRFLAEDVVQEAFFKAYKKMDTIVEEEKIGAWLSAITTRTAIDFIRKERRSKALLLEQTIIENENHSTGSDQTIENEVEYVFLKENLEQVIGLLSTDQQEVLLLKAHLGLKETEIARQLKLTPATVKMRLYRARKQLKSLYNEKYSA